MENIALVEHTQNSRGEKGAVIQINPGDSNGDFCENPITPNPESTFQVAIVHHNKYLMSIPDGTKVSRKVYRKELLTPNAAGKMCLKRDCNMEICMQEVYWRLLGSAPGREESRIVQGGR